MKVEVQEANDAALDVVRNLVSLYVYDLSEVMGWECPDSGIYEGCRGLSHEAGQPG